MTFEAGSRSGAAAPTEQGLEEEPTEEVGRA